MTKVINPNVPSFIPDTYRIGIDNYIGEKPNNIRIIEEKILTHKTVLIDAPTNSGKSTVMGALFQKWINLENRRCYYLLPKIIQQHQFEKTYLKGIPVINSAATAEAKEEAQVFGANITWQGFLMSDYDKGLTENDIVIVDEAHLLINNQSFIGDTKHLVRKLQRGKFKVVLMSGTPNYVAFADLFNCETISFHFNQPPPRHIQPVLIDGKLVDNVTEYLRSLKFEEDGLNIIRVNDKDKHAEIANWAVEALPLTENEIQIVNKDIADPRWISPDYQYLIDNDAIDPAKKLLITTIFSDEGININNTNIKSIAIFYDPRLRTSSQRCRDSVIQFCSRFRNLHLIDNYPAFSIKLFIPAHSNETGTQDYYHLFDVQRRTANRLLAQLIDTKESYNNQTVMQSFPVLQSGTDPQTNLVIEIGNSYFEVNKQGIYFNTKSLVDRFKTNAEFLTELSTYFVIDETKDFTRDTNLEDRDMLRKARSNRLLGKVEAFRPLKEHPADIINSIAKKRNLEDLTELSAGLTPSRQGQLNGTDGYAPMLIQAIEEDAPWLAFLKKINFPVGEFAGLLLHKREFHDKMRFLRFLLSRAAGSTGSMNNLYYIANYKPYTAIVEAISAEFIGKGFHPKNAVKQWISIKMPYYLKTKRIDATMIIDELFVTEEKRDLENGKKVSYISIIRKREVNDVVLDFLFYNEQHYPTVDGIKDIADDYAQKQREHNVQQGAYRNNETADALTKDKITLGKARVEMEKSKKMLQAELFNNSGFMLKVNQIAEEMINRFTSRIKELDGSLKKLDKLEPAGNSEMSEQSEQVPNAA